MTDEETPQEVDDATAAARAEIFGALDGTTLAEAGTGADEDADEDADGGDAAA
jgi:hypothetical protein